MSALTLRGRCERYELVPSRRFRTVIWHTSSDQIWFREDVGTGGGPGGSRTTQWVRATRMTDQGT